MMDTEQEEVKFDEEFQGLPIDKQAGRIMEMNI